jgi:hypothetical protein
MTAAAHPIVGLHRRCDGSCSVTGTPRPLTPGGTMSVPEEAPIEGTRRGPNRKGPRRSDRGIRGPEWPRRSPRRRSGVGLVDRDGDGLTDRHLALQKVQGHGGRVARLRGVQT